MLFRTMPIAGLFERRIKIASIAVGLLVVLPSASENFGIAAVEALAVDTPTILRPTVAVAQDIASASTALIVSAEPSLLSEVLECALGGPPQFMLEAARRIALEAFSWPGNSAQLRDLSTTILR